MSETWYEYSIYCCDEAATVSACSKNPPPPIGTGPVVYPNNNTHTVVAASVFELDRISESIVTINEENVTPPPGQPLTGKRFQDRCISFQALPNAVHNETVSWPKAVTILQFDLHQNIENLNDDITIQIGEDFVVGATTAVVTGGTTTVIDVSSSVVGVAKIGFYLFLENGNDKEEIGEIIAIDTVNNQLTLHQNTATANYDIGSSVFVVSKPLINHCIRWSGVYKPGEAKSGGYYVPVNMNLHIYYTNKSLTDTKIMAIGINTKY